MPDEQDPLNTNSLTDPEHPLLIGVSDLPWSEQYQLAEIARGRMLCVNHGRVCYSRVFFTGEKEWICPDERHRKPIRDS